MRLIKQEEACGCGIASLAMVLDLKYKDVAKDFNRTFEHEGTSESELVDYLGEHCCELLIKRVNYTCSPEFGRKELSKPFAPAHLLLVKYRFDSDLHAVAMDSKGKIFCPDSKEHTPINEWYALRCNIGVWRVKPKR